MPLDWKRLTTWTGAMDADDGAGTAQALRDRSVGGLLGGRAATIGRVDQGRQPVLIRFPLGRKLIAQGHFWRFLARHHPDLTQGLDVLTAHGRS